MQKLMVLLAMAGLAAAPAPLSKADDASLRAAVTGAFKPYWAGDPDKIPSSWDFPVYSRPLKDQIGKWKKLVVANADDITPLSDADWLCQCQDYDPKKAKIISVTPRATPTGAEAKVIFTAGWNDRDSMRLLMVKEGNRWVINDLYFSGGTTPLSRMLRDEIAEAQKRKK